VLIHACGVDDGGRGYLFVGQSGHGKTTMARLWGPGATILSDDRIIVRRRDDRYVIFGTPWHGELDAAAAQEVPLDKVFVLRHAEASRAEPITGAAAAAILLARCFPPFWDRTGMSFTLDWLGRLVSEVPCYDLGFVPEPAVCDLVRCTS
jgi:hypothetical protein